MNSIIHDVTRYVGMFSQTLVQSIGFVPPIKNDSLKMLTAAN